MSSYPGDQRWADEQHAKRVNELADADRKAAMPCPACAEKDTELSRALGLIDAAHVVLTSEGAEPHAAIADRISVFVAQLQTRIEDAEARATAAEQREAEKDATIRAFEDGSEAAAVRGIDMRTRLDVAEASTKAQREAIEAAIAKSFQSGYGPLSRMVDMRGILRAALASPSTPPGFVNGSGASTYAESAPSNAGISPGSTPSPAPKWKCGGCGHGPHGGVCLGGDGPVCRCAGQPEQDVVCEHGTAADVHCCNCHSGFVFRPESCVCGSTPSPAPSAEQEQP